MNNSLPNKIAMHHFVRKDNCEMARFHFPINNRKKKRCETYCVRKVKAADVMDEGRWRPLMISCHSFLLMTSTSPPRATTKLYSSYRSNTCLAMIGKRVIGVPVKKQNNNILNKKNKNEKIGKTISPRQQQHNNDYRRGSSKRKLKTSTSPFFPHQLKHLITFFFSF